MYIINKYNVFKIEGFLIKFMLLYIRIVMFAFDDTCNTGH